MARKQYREDEVLNSLSSKKDIRIIRDEIQILSDYIYTFGGKILNPKKTFDLGNGSWGKIDFLTKNCGYHICFIEKF